MGGYGVICGWPRGGGEGGGYGGAREVEGGGGKIDHVQSIY